MGLTPDTELKNLVEEAIRNQPQKKTLKSKLINDQLMWDKI